MRSGPLRELVSFLEEREELIAQTTFENPPDPAIWYVAFNATIGHAGVVMTVTPNNPDFQARVGTDLIGGALNIEATRFLDVFVDISTSQSPTVLIMLNVAAQLGESPIPEGSAEAGIGDPNVEKLAETMYRVAAPGSYTVRFDLTAAADYAGTPLGAISLANDSGGLNAFGVRECRARAYDANGEPWGEWVELFQEPAQRIPRGSREYTRRGLHRSEETTLFRLRWQDGVDTSWRIEHDGVQYSIEGPPLNPDARGREMVIEGRAVGGR